MLFSARSLSLKPTSFKLTIQKRGVANTTYFVPSPAFNLYNQTNNETHFLEERESEMKKLLGVVDMVSNSKSLLVITGAGISTESGVPDYRSPNGSYSKGHKPILFQDFLKNEFMKKRFWLRSMIYYRYKYSKVSPNKTHYLLKSLEEKGKVNGLVTQNVDGLHHKLNQQNYVELHGNLRSTVCVECKREYDRTRVQQYIEEKNAKLIETIIANKPSGMDVEHIRSDGDVNLENLTDDLINQFHLPFCFDHCGESAKLKPSVVFFGESVPRERVDQVDQFIDSSDALLVLGTSLQVYSSYRIVRKMHEKRSPISIINIGETRADPLTTYKLNQICSESLEYIYRSLYPDESLDEILNITKNNH